MPFWAGMLTERQHPHPKLGRAVRQAAWDLYFRHDPVCAPPDFVTDPGIDLDAVLGGQPVLILRGKLVQANRQTLLSGASSEDIDEHIREVKRMRDRVGRTFRKPCCRSKENRTSRLEHPMCRPLPVAHSDELDARPDLTWPH